MRTNSAGSLKIVDHGWWREGDQPGAAADLDDISESDEDDSADEGGNENEKETGEEEDVEDEGNDGNDGDTKEQKQANPLSLLSNMRNMRTPLSSPSHVGIRRATRKRKRVNYRELKNGTPKASFVMIVSAYCL